MKVEIQLDEMMTPERAASWLQISMETLMEKYRKKQIPGAAIGHRTVRFHPRTVIAKLAFDGGVSPKVIAAMFNMPP